MSNENELAAAERFRVTVKAPVQVRGMPFNPGQTYKVAAHVVDELGDAIESKKRV